MTSTWTLHPDRALPADPVLRGLARDIYAAVADLPIVSMHGHVEAELLARDEPFSDPAELLVRPDHYLVRMLVSAGLPHGGAGIGPAGQAEADPRAIWRMFCENWKLFRGTPTRYWMEDVLALRLGVSAPPSAETADHLYDEILDRLAQPGFRPLALLQEYGIELIATTDPATATLEHHHELAERGWGERIIPTFRPDALIRLDRPGLSDSLAELEERSGVPTSDYEGYIAALEERRRAFVAAGARASDHGHLRPESQPLEPGEARRIYAEARRGEVTPAQADAFEAHMVHEMARMASQDGLTMQLHVGVLRDYHDETRRLRGPDVGYDIPVATEFTRALRPLLQSFGHHPNFRLIVFTIDETVYSRELAPLAGVFPSMRLGAPWWFLDTADAMRRFREAATDAAGFYNTSGFVDDTRAFLSIPARHDLARRVDAGHLARLVAEHRLGKDEAIETAADLAYLLPKQSYPVPPRTVPRRADAG